MQKIDRPTLLTSIFNPLSRRDRLEFAESASLIGSAVGSIVAGLSGQVLFAATPLTLALWLNAMNRNRFEEQMRLEHQGAIADLHQVVQSLHTSVEKFPRSERINAVEDSLLRLSEAIADLQERHAQLSAPPEPLHSPEIREEFAVVRRALVRLRNHTEASFTEVQDNLQREIQSLRQDLVSSPTTQPLSELSRLEQQLTTLSETFARVQAELQVLANRPELNLNQTQTQISELQQQITQLQQQNREIVKPYLKHLTRAMKQLQEKREL